MVYGTYSIHGLYKPTNITGGPHIASLPQFIYHSGWGMTGMTRDDFLTTFLAELRNRKWTSRTALRHWSSGKPGKPCFDVDVGSCRMWWLRYFNGNLGMRGNFQWLQDMIVGEIARWLSADHHCLRWCNCQGYRSKKIEQRIENSCSIFPFYTATSFHVWDVI